MNRITCNRLAAALLVIGPTAFTLADLLRRLVVPSGSPKAPAITHAVDGHDGVWLVVALLAVVAALCLAPGVLALLPSGGRGARVTAVGTVMVVVGALASMGHAVAFYSPYALFARAGTPDAELTALDHASESYPMLVVLIALFLVGMMLGTVVLFVGLRRARRVPIWSLIAAVVFVACGGSGGVPAGVLGVVAALVAFVPAARAVLVEPATAG